MAKDFYINVIQLIDETLLEEQEFLLDSHTILIDKLVKLYAESEVTATNLEADRSLRENISITREARKKIASNVEKLKQELKLLQGMQNINVEELHLYNEYL